MKIKPTSDPLKFITRMDAERSWKLQMSASATAKGAAVQLYFGDARFGGKKAALAAAQITREALRHPTRKLDHRNSTVKTAQRLLPAGVTRLIDRRLDAQGHPRYDIIWVAYWMEPMEGGRMRQARRRFSVRAHGYESAFFKARKLRAEKSGFDIRGHPCPALSDILAGEEEAPLIISQLRELKPPRLKAAVLRCRPAGRPALGLAASKRTVSSVSS